ncbi:MAG: glycosyltransferase [Clostridia bacterium]|nr:glycosyltransferase [Clostridia bacterium]
MEGGIGTYVENCAKMFAKSGDDVTVIVRGNNNTTLQTTKEGYKVLRFKQCSKPYYSYLGYENSLAYQYYEEIKDLIKIAGKPDIIETQEYNALGQYLIQNKYLLEKELQDIPIVVHLHTPSFETLRINQFNRYEHPYYWIGEMEKFCIKGADALLCPSQFLADKLKYLVPDKEIKVINLPFSIEQEDIENYSKKEITQKQDKKTILYFGRTEYRKGVLQMLKGAKELWNKGLDFKIKIIGGDTILDPKGTFIGEDIRHQYKEYIKNGNLEMLASIPTLELIPHILSSTAVTIPSIYENFPNTCIYSMWLGKPVLVSKSGGQAEMVNTSYENGIIFDWEIEGDFTKKLEELLNMSDETLEKMGSNAKNRIYSLCNMESNLKQRKAFFEKVIETAKMQPVKNKFPFVEEIKKDNYIKEYSVEKDLLSIVIPYYNLGQTISETILSIKKSTYKNYEIIIVNDGSTDKESISILEEFKNDTQIKIINIENKGLANARNVGAENAKGEFLAFIDADDKIEETFYEKAIKILNQYDNVSYIYSWVQYFEGDNANWITFNTHIPYLLCANMLAAFAVIRKNDFLNFGKNRVEMEYGMEDYDSWVSLASHGCLGVSIPEYLNIYRVRKNSMARQFNKKMRIYLYDVLSHNYPDLYAKYAVEVFMLLMANGQPYYWNIPTVKSNQPEVGTITYDERVVQIRKFLNSRLGRIAKKIFYGFKINKLFKL